MKQIGAQISTKNFYKVTVICITFILCFSFILVLPKINSFGLSNNNITSLSSKNNSSFMETLRQYPWEALLHAYQNKKNDTSKFSLWCSKLFLKLTPFIIAESKVNINFSCTPPPLQFPSSMSPCTKLSKPRKVAVLLQHGFDADTLEIHFHELGELVDKFFIIESTLTYYLGVGKPLIWERLKEQPRFEKFVPKVVHLVLDDEELLKVQLETVKEEEGQIKDSIYNIEAFQEKMRWLKFLRWNNITKFFGDEDILGFGDVDEIPNRNVIFHLKHCEMFGYPVDIGTWFPYGRIYQAFRTDYPVGNHAYTYGDPTYWTFKKALNFARRNNFKKIPTRKRGTSGNFVVGGIHMTHYGYLPFQLAKLLTTIEAVDVGVQNKFAKIIRFLMNELRMNETLSKGEEIQAFKNVEEELSKTPAEFLGRIVKVEKLKLEFEEEYTLLVKLPWFYDCNRERYPTWEGKHDERLD
ncbi:unnamed protein product [Orchesella dallaii]|uniref:Beta-1,4-mannosyl-glycoprotein 4-beta-N-acetylglucosaminyltransferase n=1 Tax=Orchesella dallaii TaxID=48710 RepID=A0ABP1RLK0_9HEXA